MRPGDRDQDGPAPRDLAYRVLATAVSAMRHGRQEWGQAMLAELDHVRSPAERAWFALGTARVALFPPRATPAWWAVPLSLAIRAVVAGAAIHALAPAAGPVPAALMALPAAGAWGLVTMPALASRAGGVVPTAQVAVAAGVVGCLALALATVQRFPQVMGASGPHAWGIGVVFDVVSAGYLWVAWRLSRRFSATQRNILYALGAGLVLATVAGLCIAHPSLISVWIGPLHGNGPYLLACLAVPAASALAVGRRGRKEDGLETAAWASLLASLITSILIIAATIRVAPAADGSRQVIADARLHGAASASAWLAGDNLGGAIFMLIWDPLIFMTLAWGGMVIGRAGRAAALNLAAAAGPVVARRRERHRARRY
jgi:hypothetical protein